MTPIKLILVPIDLKKRLFCQELHFESKITVMEGTKFIYCCHKDNINFESL